MENENGKEYILYGYKDKEGKLVSHACSGSKEILNENEIDSLYDKDYYSIIYRQEMQFIRDIEKSKNGSVKTYYSNGNLTASGNYENYNPTGYWEYYTFDNQIISKGRYENYEKNGVWIEFSYSQKTYIDKDGKQKYKLVLSGFKKGEYLNGKKIGYWQTFGADEDVPIIK